MYGIYKFSGVFNFFYSVVVLYCKQIFMCENYVICNYAIFINSKNLVIINLKEKK